MKAVTFAICCALICTCKLSAQTSWNVKAGQEMKDAISPAVKFRYPQFVSGSVYFKNGIVSQAQLDFNLLNEEMQFINPNGDTLSIDNEATINYITINNDTFFYSKGYLELLPGNASVKLAKKQRLKIGDIKKIGGYDQASSASAITSYSAINTGGEYTKINQRADILLLKETTYYIGDNYNHFLQANKKNLMKMFSEKESLIANFLEEKKIRFNNEGDLKELINFLQKTL